MTRNQTIERKNIHRLAGALGYIYILTITVWIVITFVYQKILYPAERMESFYDGLTYYSVHKGYIGWDHGSKSIVFFLSSLIPIATYDALKREQTSVVHLAGMIFGVISFWTLSLSFILQAFTMEYAIGLFQSAEDPLTQHFAVNLARWSGDGGGFSLSLYTISYMSLALWIAFLLKGDHSVSTLMKFLSVITVVAHIAVPIAVFIAFITTNKNYNDLNGIADILFIIWLFFHSRRLWRREM